MMGDAWTALGSRRPRFNGFLWIACAASLALPGCKRALETGACPEEAQASDAVSCEVPGFEDRGYDLLVPDDYDGRPVGVILAFHGGGGSRKDAANTTCPRGRVDDPQCLHNRALKAGYAVVLPDGTADERLGRFRTWNAGGGVEDFRCVSGEACERGIDDMAYFDALMADLEGRLAVDDGRVFAAGLSNGGAIAHRLACQKADRIAAIVAVGGAMQLTVSQACEPSRPVPVLQVHGTEDPCWRFEGGVPDCAGGLSGQPGKRHVAVSRTMGEWAQINGCGQDTGEEALEDTQDDGTASFRVTHQGCEADTVLIRVEGGGHAWPQGNPFLSESAIGRVPQDWGNEVILQWFDDHPMP